MQELIRLSRGVAAELAAKFRGDPAGELAAGLHIALERESLVASLYDGHSMGSRLESLPWRVGRCAAAKVNAIRSNEETHVAIIRALLGADCLVRRALTEGWGRLQGMVLNQLASSQALARAMGLFLLELGARSAEERAAGRAVASLDAGHFLTFSRTLEVTAVESYQRVATLLTMLRRAGGRPPYTLSLHLTLLRILRDERVHRDVFHVLHRMLNGAEAAPARAPYTELPTAIAAQPVSSATELNGLCRTILAFHYGVAIPAGAAPEEVVDAAVSYWQWQLSHPRRHSYLFEHQMRQPLPPERDILLCGTAGLAGLVRGVRWFRRFANERLLPKLIESGRVRGGRRYAMTTSYAAALAANSRP